MPDRTLLDEVNGLTAEITAVEREATRRVTALTKQRDMALLKANRRGWTYDALVAECSLSDGYIAQAVRRARERAPERLAARPPHNPANRGPGQRKARAARVA